MISHVKQIGQGRRFAEWAAALRAGVENDTFWPDGV